MTKDELKNKLKELIPQAYGKVKKSEVAATEYDELTKFPELKSILVDLLTIDFNVFIASIDWVAPRPTTFRINLKNGQSFYLIWNERSWIAQVEGKRYYLLNLPEEQRAAQSIATILRYGTKDEAAATTTPPAEEPAAEEPATEEPAAEEPAAEEPVAEGTVDKTNETLRGLTGRQMQNLMRIIRKHQEGELSKLQALVLIRGGYGLNDIDANALLNTNEPQIMSTDNTELPLQESKFKKLKQILNENIKLKELTVDPDYRSKGVFNPFYTIDSDLDTEIKLKLKQKKIKSNNIIYKAVKQPGTNIILDTGKIPFELFSDENTSLKLFITIPKNKVKAHYGNESRKNSTASSNVNEFLSLYFLTHPGDFKDGAESFINKVNSKNGDTGVFTGDGESVTYERLAQLLASDESSERDIKIGYNNAIAVKKDIGSDWDKLYWTPRAKPEGIAPNNPSDIIIKLNDGSFQGYSNKIAAGKDVTPKFNTNVIAFYSKKGDESQVSNIKELIDLSWNEAAKTIPSSAKNAKKAIKLFNISDEDFSETSSKASFAELAREFDKDKLNFYGEDFYYKFRNNFITNFSKYLENLINLKYFINTIGFYTYGDEAASSTPCPYKLLIGSESGSTIKDVSEDQQLKDIITTKLTKNIKNIKNSYDGSSQSFIINFDYKLGKEIKSVSIPVTTRTRASGGWSGKALYINTPGVKVS